MKIAYMPDTHFGVFDQPLPGPDEVADAAEHLLVEAELAESVGFDGCWLPERHARTETYFPATIPLLAALAARTKRVDLATTVMMPTFHHPVHLAEALAAIDNLSRGRLLFGAGVGYHEDYFRHFGVPFEQRGRRFEETMEVIEGCWTQEEFSYDGEFFQYDRVRMTPKPYQRPRPPVWIGAFAPRALERAADWDGWVTWFPEKPETLRSLVDEMREKADKKGRKDWQVGIALEGWLSDEPGLREKHAYRWVNEVNFYGERGLSPDIDEVMARNAALVDQMEDSFLCLGNRQKWLDRLGAYKEIVGPDWICLHIRTPRAPEGYYPSKNECLEVIEGLGEVIDGV